MKWFAQLCQQCGEPLFYFVAREKPGYGDLVDYNPAYSWTGDRLIPMVSEIPHCRVGHPPVLDHMCIEETDWRPEKLPIK